MGRAGVLGCGGGVGWDGMGWDGMNKNTSSLNTNQKESKL